MKYFAAFLFSIVIGCLSLTEVQAQEEFEPIESINSYIDEALLLVKSEEYEQAVLFLQLVSSEIFSEEAEISLLLKEPHLHLLMLESFDDALVTIENEISSHEQKVLAMLKFRLLSDAVLYEDEPLWLQYKGALYGKLNSFHAAIVDNDSIVIQTTINELLTLMETIRPSIMYQLPKTESARFYNQMNELDELRVGFFSKEEATEVYLKTKESMDEVFGENDRSIQLDDLSISAIMILSVIFVSLAFVGWRKYSYIKK